MKMKTIKLLGIVTFAFSFGFAVAASQVSAGVINTLPGDSELAASNLAQGGTFVADDTNLAEFTITIGGDPVRRARPFLLDTTATGEPTMGPVLWEGPDVDTSLVAGDITFTPNVPLTVGKRYFIGLDYGFFTSVVGEIVLFSARSDNPIPDGRAWKLFASGWDPFSPNVDIGARIVMNSTGPICDIQMSKSNYNIGDTVTATTFRLANPSSEPVAVEWKVWLVPAALPPVSVINVGADGSVILPPGSDFDFGPLSLFPGNVPGPYEFSCRLLDPTTGALLFEDLNPFSI